MDEMTGKDVCVEDGVCVRLNAFTTVLLGVILL